MYGFFRKGAGGQIVILCGVLMEYILDPCRRKTFWFATRQPNTVPDETMPRKITT
jgi:hypothetical protein